MYVFACTSYTSWQNCPHNSHQISDYTAVSLPLLDGLNSNRVTSVRSVELAECPGHVSCCQARGFALRSVRSVELAECPGHVSCCQARDFASRSVRSVRLAECPEHLSCCQARGFGHVAKWLILPPSHRCAQYHVFCYHTLLVVTTQS
jgi:hypothetical protein